MKPTPEPTLPGTSDPPDTGEPCACDLCRGRSDMAHPLPADEPPHAQNSRQNLWVLPGGFGKQVTMRNDKG